MAESHRHNNRQAPFSWPAAERPGPVANRKKFLQAATIPGRIGRSAGAATALPAFARFAGPETVFLSIMAGRNVAGMRGLLGGDAAIIRAMPNTPAAVRQGFTVGFPGPGVTDAQQALADRLLAAIGETA